MPRSNQFLENLKQEKSEIETQPKVYIPSDKTTNMYLMEPKSYSELLKKKTSKNNTKKKKK